MIYQVGGGAKADSQSLEPSSENFLHMKEPNKNFNDITVNKVRKYQRIISLESGELEFGRNGKKEPKEGLTK